MRLLLKLLRKNVNFWQLVGFASANLVGAVIVLLGMQAYQDAESLVSYPDNLLSSNVVVLSKPVEETMTISGLLGDKPSFSPEEVEAIAEIQGVTDVAPFVTSEFSVYGTVIIDKFNVSTQMFLESVPDQFLDVKTDEWYAELDDEVIPVIIPKNYLNFYNYGFAAAKGTPQIGESLLSDIPISFILRGDDIVKRYDGVIVGSTDKINSILVPQDFLIQANREFSSNHSISVTRVVVKTDGNDVADLMSHISENGYVIDGDGKDSMKLLSIVRTIISVVVAIGLLVSALSFFLLLISILLLIEKNRYQNQTLSQIGYPKSRIALPYQLLVLVVDAVVWILALLITVIVYPYISDIMTTVSVDFESVGLGMTALAAGALFVFFAFFHAVLIRYKIK